MADKSKAKENPPAAKSGGCLGKLLVLLLLPASVGLCFAAYFMAQPQDLSDIRGYSPATRTQVRPNLKAMLQQSKDTSYPLILSEEVLNQWLHDVLQTKQGGLLGEYVTFSGLWVRLEDGRAELIMERKVMGRPFTVSTYLKIEQTESTDGTNTHVTMHGGPFHPAVPYPNCGGRIGRLQVPQGYLILILPALEKLANALSEECKLGWDGMARIKIEKGRLILDPRHPNEMPPGVR